MEFRSNFNLLPSENKIEYSNSLFFIGSCFSNHISKILKTRKFNVQSNPFGILYNPISVFDNLINIITQKEYTEKDLFLKDQVWNCFDFHSEMSGTDQQKTLKNINTNIKSSYAFLTETKTLFITFGTAWVYELELKTVANCFKMDAQKFTKRLLSIEEIVAKAESLINQIKTFNKHLNIVFTVSPVRHLKDGFIENNQSKSTLLLAIKKICEKFENASYFPAYELIIDDLRDYRFYNEDLVHPNKLAIKYVLEKFDIHYFKANTLEIIKKIEKINSSLNHSVRFKNTENYSIFKSRLIKSIIEIEKLGFDFTKEKESLV